MTRSISCRVRGSNSHRPGYVQTIRLTDAVRKGKCCASARITATPRLTARLPILRDGSIPTAIRTGLDISARKRPSPHPRSTINPRFRSCSELSTTSARRRTCQALPNSRRPTNSWKPASGPYSRPNAVCSTRFRALKTSSPSDGGAHQLA